MWLYGYRVGEVPLPELPESKVGSRVGDLYARLPTDIRFPVSVSAGVHCSEVCPHPDNTHGESMRSGVVRRLLVKPPAGDPVAIGRLKKFVHKWVRENLVPLSPNTDLSVETWLETTLYTLRRKEQLLQLSRDGVDILDVPRDLRCKCFGKDEFYPEPKHVRCICSRTDRFKVAVGPTFKAIEKVVFQLGWFIKKIPVADRAAYIKERLARVGAKYIATDYTSFESLFTPEIMDAVEFELYEYMTSELPVHSWFMRVCRDVLGGLNFLQFKHFDAGVEGDRMSGEMCTSLGNGFSNLMFMLFVCDELEIEPMGVVEGDDGLFVVDDWPLESNTPSVGVFKTLGLNIKLEVHHELSSASFCGLLFDPVDEIIVTDVREVLATMSWINTKYRDAKTSKLRGLLRCKALSYAHQYPGCPIVQSFAHNLLRLTRSLDVRYLLLRSAANEYEREIYSSFLKQKIPFKAVGYNTRLLVESRYGVSVHAQLALESYFDTMEDFVPVPSNLTYFLPEVWREYSGRYMRPRWMNNPELGDRKSVV